MAGTSKLQPARVQQSQAIQTQANAWQGGQLCLLMQLLCREVPVPQAQRSCRHQHVCLLGTSCSNVHRAPAALQNSAAVLTRSDSWLHTSMPLVSSEQGLMRPLLLS